MLLTDPWANVSGTERSCCSRRKGEGGPTGMYSLAATGWQSGMRQGRHPQQVSCCKCPSMSTAEATRIETTSC